MEPEGSGRKPHVLFVHQSFPAQFGHIAAYLVRELGWRCTFVSQREPGEVAGIRIIEYQARGGATESTHYFSRAFENAVWHAAGVYEALKPVSESLEPDLIVGHSGFGSTVFLPELFPGVPVINQFEYFYRAHSSDLDFRPEWPVAEEDVLRTRTRNAMVLLDLEYCTAGYSPTRFQYDLLPEAYRSKIKVIHDGIDTSFWQRRQVGKELRESLGIPTDGPVVTYVSRGLEAMRGFDVFMRMANLLLERRNDVTFLVVGSDRVAYGGDLRHIDRPSFKEHVLGQDDYDLDRIRFLGNVKPEALVHILSLSDLHVYLTVPFVLSWSVLNAMACECVVLGSDTAPVREVIRDGENGLLRDFFNAEALADAAEQVLEEPDRHRVLGAAARRTLEERYALGVVIPQMVDLYRSAAGRAGGGSPGGA
jgi:glycosyltransferase involved in cell wall biosynthesis